MLNELRDGLDSLFGNTSTELTAGNVAARAVVTFIVTVAVIRLGNKRLFGKGTAFDTVVAIMIGSVMSRAITGSGAGTMLGTWSAGLALIAMHWLLSWLSYHIESLGTLFKGHQVQLVDGGEMVGAGMQRTGTTPRDLDRAMRASGTAPDVSRIKLSYMERDGSISVVPKSTEPKILDISVQDGVQTVRIALE